MRVQLLLLLCGQLLLVPTKILTAPSLGILGQFVLSTIGQETNSMWTSLANVVPYNRKYSQLQASDHCESCKLAVTSLRLLIRYGANEDKFANVIETMCIRLKIMRKDICSGVVKAFKVR